MKAIINTKKSHGMSYLNGQTFEVVQLMEDRVIIATPSIIIKGNLDYVYFDFSEIPIVDVLEEYKNPFDGKTFQNLTNYMLAKKILF